MMNETTKPSVDTTTEIVPEPLFVFKPTNSKTVPSVFNFTKPDNTTLNCSEKKNPDNSLFSFQSDKAKNSEDGHCNFKFSFKSPVQNKDSLQLSENTSDITKTDLMKQTNMELHTEPNYNKEAVNESNEKLHNDLDTKSLLIVFKETINAFVKERIDHEKRIAALEKKIEAFENEKHSKNENSRNCASVDVSKNMTVCAVCQSRPTLPIQSKASCNSSAQIVFGLSPIYDSTSNINNSTIRAPTPLPQTTIDHHLCNAYSQTNNISPSTDSRGLQKGISLYQPNLTEARVHDRDGINIGVLSCRAQKCSCPEIIYNNDNALVTSLSTIDRKIENKELNSVKDLKQTQNKINTKEMFQWEELKQSIDKTVTDLFEELKTNLKTHS